ncbi:putative Nudix hydrolase NudL [Austwickia sp. TVS 96-490-7B]|uniref:NUDIX hydrolase n=1 Tax=Austwickia sp. TVS 96-490-7B TaxID=2830843 RepID=UPI001C55C903|nr:CoA pyrophosphatase [Austwickia sp. TVS 96-490-7B]MBW3084923.1 putative Nudix hydrolase NudL [Austwickia sp. TVS 96-490-7B]
MTRDLATSIPPGPPRPGGPPPWLHRAATAATSPGAAYFERHRTTPGRRERTAAVLMLFGPCAHGGEDVVLTRRTPHLRSHAGQVAFPGGRIDPDDAGPVAAALREAEEEIGLDPTGVHVVAELPELDLSASRSAVTPVLAWWEHPSPICAHSEQEVDRVARVPLRELLDPTHRFVAVHPSGYAAPAFDVDGLFIWGFTAALLTATFELGGVDPGGWNRSLRRNVPDQGGTAASPPSTGEVR